MRLTTRLMQIASWLLLQRAANNGEMSRAQVAEEKSKVQLETPSASRATQSWEELPLKFIDIVERSLQMQTLVKRFDEQLYPKADTALAAEPKRNAVNDQMTLLRAAFGGRKTIFVGNTFSAFFCVSTCEKPLERISMRPAALSLVLSQNPCANCDSI